MNKMSDGARKEPWIWGLIRNDFQRKLFAVIIALLVTLLVNGTLDDQVTEKNIENVPVNFLLPEGFRLSAPPEDTVTVTVKGKRSMLEQLKASEFRIDKNVTGSSLHDGNVRITASDVTVKRKKTIKNMLSDDPEVTAVSPGVSHLALDREITREEIPININYDWKELPQGYVLEQIDRPENQRFVTVRGPSRIVSGLKKIETERIPLDKATQDFTTTVALQSPGEGVTLSFDRVTCTFRISGQKEKDFVDVPVQLLLDQKHDGLSYNVAPRTVTVNLAEPVNEAGMTKKEHLHPYVLAAGLKEGTIQCDVQCWCEKNNVRIISVNPEKVTVRVDPVPVKPQPAKPAVKK